MFDAKRMIAEMEKALQWMRLPRSFFGLPTVDKDASEIDGTVIAAVNFDAYNVTVTQQKGGKPRLSVIVGIVIPGCRTFPNGDPGYPDDYDYEDVAECELGDYRGAALEIIKHAFSCAVEDAICDNAMARAYIED